MNAIYRRNAPAVQSGFRLGNAWARQIFADNPLSRAYIIHRIMPKISPLLTAAALSLCAALAFAQEAPSIEKAPEPVKKAEEIQLAQNTAVPRPKPKPPAADTAEAPIPEIISTPKPKKPGFFKRLFGPRKPKEEATPTPPPASTPTPTPRKTARPAAATPQPEKIKTGASTAPAKPDMPVVAAPTSAKTTAKATPKPKPVAEPPADTDPDVQEKFRFDQAKVKAMEDPQVKALKAKADNAATEEESSKALRAYNKALFEKIRKIDKTVAERATRLEAAILKRLSE